MLAALLFVLVSRWLEPSRPHQGYRIHSAPAFSYRTAAKPAWVRKELIRLKALMPHAGCRTIADCFNRRFAAKRNVTVGKTFVADLIRRHCYEIALETKSSWTLVRKLAESIRRFGKPQAVRTDNEPVFTSRVFRAALLLLGIRHQRTDLHCPWQNGRVERFFGTLKRIHTSSATTLGMRSPVRSPNSASTTTTSDRIRTCTA